MRPAIFCFCLITSTVAAADPSLLQAARQAIREGIPQVGISKLERYLAEDLPPADLRAVYLELVAAELQIGKTADARAHLTKLAPGARVDFLVVQSYLIDQDWLEVIRRLATLPPADSPEYPGSVFARAEALRGLGKYQAADKDYQSLENDPTLGNAARLRRSDLALIGHPVSLPAIQLSSTDDLAAIQSATLLTAQSRLLANDYPEARRLFASLLENPAQLTLSDYAAVHVGLARAKSELGDGEEAGDLLEKFIEERPQHPRLSDVFAELNHTYEKQRNPSRNQLGGWSKDAANPQRQALAIYYQSQFDLREKGSDAALKTLASWLGKFPSHPLRASVLLYYGEQLLAENKIPEGTRRLTEGLALPSSPSVTGGLHAAMAGALFSANHFAEAAEHYEVAATLLGSSAENLLYNTALCWLRASNFENFLGSYQKLSGLFPESDLRRDLLIEEGFLQARSGKSTEARDTLELFIRDFPGHPRIPDAHLALAELALNDVPDRVGPQLVLAAQTMPSREVEQRAEYLQFLLAADSENQEHDTKKQIAQCETFLREHPSSSFEAEVRFKLGEAWFAEKNFTAAGTQFETISSKFPDSPYVEQARFLAGQSAVRTMNPQAIDGAISQFEDVVRMKGPLQAYARFEQAGVKKRNGAFEEALVLYNDLLGQKLPPDLLAPTLAEKAETLYLQGNTDLAKVSESVTTYDRLANLPGVSRYWRNLALYKKGKGLQWLGKPDEMLTAFYDALEAPSDTDGTPEYQWFYRAGYDAAENLEAGGKWEAAIAIYRKLAEAKGPRSAEAAERIQRLRLEHFIWEK